MYFQINKQESNLITPLNTVLKGELKEVKGDLKRPFEKAAKDYETKHAKYEKEVKQQVNLFFMLLLVFVFY